MVCREFIVQNVNIKQLNTTTYHTFGNQTGLMLDQIKNSILNKQLRSYKLMKLENALFCLDCDEIFYDLDSCPSCGNHIIIPLKDWIKPMHFLKKIGDMWN